MQGWGRRELKVQQMDRMTRFYERWGTWAIFWTRFLHGLRAVVPVFAVVTQQRFGSVAVPLAAASAIWYGTLSWVGAVNGQSLEAMSAVLRRSSGALTELAAVVLLVLARWRGRTKDEASDA